ncbi:hypothetical protein AeMF1_021386 [Aphanomyces euteiches]|nr:hypothetical protein AeMF1_021386 [Aphanomyces euteiches]KAH9185657.1 hypothetical protein AeNC1_012366 [Aphanomyces euteiches]
MIKQGNSDSITCDAKFLQLYSAATGPATWLSVDDPDLRGLSLRAEGNTVMPQYVNDAKKMNPVFGLDTYFNADIPKRGHIHVLVVLPRKKGERTEEELSTLDPQVQRKLWKSVVRITVDDSFGLTDASTALVVERTSTHLYLLTNLHLFLDEAYSDALSDDFKEEIKVYLKMHPGKKKEAQVKHANDTGLSLRRSQRAKKASNASSNIQIAIEQVFPDEEALKKVYQFSLSSEICRDCSANFDFGVLEIPAPPTAQIDLVGCHMAFQVLPSMPVHVFGFPDNLVEGKFDLNHAIVPAQVTDMDWNEVTITAFSATRLSQCSIVCSKWGVPVGYLDGGFRESKDGQYQSYAYTLLEVPPCLPCHLPRAKKISKRKRR